MIVLAVDPDRARADAREILGDRRFRSDPAPRPLRDADEPVDRSAESILDFLGNVPWFVWIGMLVVIVALSALFVLRNYQSVNAGARSRSGDDDPTEHEDDPTALERAAAEAERAGEFDRAVRLRFRAGLLRLGARGAIEYRDSITVGEVRHRLHSREFESLAGTFEEVAYGDRRATPPDAESARRDWPRVLEQTGKR